MPSTGNIITLNTVGVATGRYGNNRSTSLIGSGGANTQTGLSDLVTDRLYTYMSYNNHSSQDAFKRRNGWKPGENRRKGGNNFPGYADLEFNLYNAASNTSDYTYFHVWAHHTSGGKWGESDGPGSKPQNWTWWTDQPKYLKCTWNGGWSTQWLMRDWTSPGAARNARIYARYNDKGSSDHASRYNGTLYSPQFKMIGQSIPGVYVAAKGEDKYYRHHSYPHYYGSHNNGYVKAYAIQGDNPKSKTYQFYLAGYGYRYASVADSGRSRNSNTVTWSGINAGGHHQHGAGSYGRGGAGRWINGWVRPTDNHELIRGFNTYVTFGNNKYNQNSAGLTHTGRWNPINP